MVDFGTFHLAIPPSCELEYLWTQLTKVTRPKSDPKLIFRPHDKNQTDFPKVSVVRHPVRWLADYYGYHHPCKIGVPEVDALSLLPRGDFDDFIRAYLDFCPGQVGKIFNAYHADIYLRVEDLPYNCWEVFRSFGLRIDYDYFDPRPSMVTWSSALVDRVIEAEWLTLEHFEYAGTYVG